MRGDEFLEKMEHIDPEIVEEAARTPRRRRPWWLGAVAAVLVVAVAAALLLRPGGSPLVTEGYAVAQAVYPETAPYPDEANFLDAAGNFDGEGYKAAYDAWWAEQRARLELPEGYDQGMEGFYTSVLRQFLSGTDGENRVCSPLNLYLALGMLSELTGGESRQQILSLLGQPDVESLRTQVAALWQANYRDDGAATSRLGASLWLNEDVSFVPETLQRLAETYHASSYQGEMGTEDFNQALRDWLNAQTGGRLTEQSQGVELDADTVLALAATIYFQARWDIKFLEENTAPATFHAPGGDLERDFMRQSTVDTYYWGEGFSAISWDMSEGKMWLVLPEEGKSPESLLTEGEAVDFLLANGDWDKAAESCIIHLSMPKFDVSAQLDLIPGLRALGVTDVFDPLLSDFSPMTTEKEELFVTQAQHAARVTVDEEGVIAAAYTVIAVGEGGVMPQDEVDFVLDRPFLFAITGETGQLLFAGVVNQP